MTSYFINLSKERYSHISLEIAAAKRSLYFWWWKYLRLSEDYWWLCKQNGKTLDKDFAEIYQYFGDVFNDSFDIWWELYGASIFGNSLSPNEVQWMNPQLQRLYGEVHWVGAVVVPMFRNKKDLIRQFTQLIKDHDPMPFYGKRDDGKRKFSANARGIRRAPIENAHRAYCLQMAISHFRELGILSQGDKYTQYWIGKLLNITPQKSNRKGRKHIDMAADRLTLRVKVNRYISRAELIIGNAEYGVFPQVKKISIPERWTIKQKKLKSAAIAEGQWRSPEVFCDEVLENFSFDTTK